MKTFVYPSRTAKSTLGKSANITYKKCVLGGRLKGPRLGDVHKLFQRPKRGRGREIFFSLLQMLTLADKGGRGGLENAEIC